MTTSQVDEELSNTLIKPFIADYPDSMNYSGATYEIEKPDNLGVVIPNGVSYAALANNLYRLGHNYHGIWIVISTLLSYNYLWNEVRVKGGAYGTGFSSGALGTLAYYSYRDPDVASAIQTYEHSGDFIRAFMESDEDLDQYIISSVAKLEPLRTPRTYGDVADGNYLRHITYDYECARRDEMMKMKKEDLASFAEILDQLGKDHTLCIIGHKEELDRCAEQLDDIRTL
jgi:Zn-dependent M16 (insulinase) family peptidase